MPNEFPHRFFERQSSQPTLSCSWYVEDKLDDDDDVVGKGFSAAVTNKQCDQKKIAQMSIKVAQNGFTRKRIDLTTLQKFMKNVGNLGKSIAAKGFKNMAKVQ